MQDREPGSKKVQNGLTYQPSSPCAEFQDAVCGAIPVPAGWAGWIIQKTLGPDIVEEQGTLASAYRHYVFIEAHRANT